MLVEAGCTVVLVDDHPLGTERTPSKLDSFRRALKKRVLRQQALCEVARFRNENVHDEEPYPLSTASRAATISPGLIEAVKRQVEVTDHFEFVESPHQADVQLVQMMLDGRVDAVLSPDGDLVIHGLDYELKDVPDKQGNVRVLVCPGVGRTPW